MNPLIKHSLILLSTAVLAPLAGYIAARQSVAVERNFSLGDMHPRVASGSLVVRDAVPGHQLGHPNISILVYGD